MRPVLPAPARDAGRAEGAGAGAGSSEPCASSELPGDAQYAGSPWPSSAPSESSSESSTTRATDARDAPTRACADRDRERVERLWQIAERHISLALALAAGDSAPEQSAEQAEHHSAAPSARSAREIGEVPRGT